MIDPWSFLFLFWHGRHTGVTLSWSGGSAVKSTSCSSLLVGFQAPTGYNTNSCNSSPRRSNTIIWLSGALHTGGAKTFIQVKYTYTQ